jgi:N-hydroxyarylamine O-acetyltransferase
MNPVGDLDDDVRAAYLRRLELDVERPSADALRRLFRRHVERVPYETMWLFAGERWTVDPVESARRIAQEGRGGYCYHLNGAFAALLSSLGYSVTRHVGGVHGPGGPDASSSANHVVLTVTGLPSEDNASGQWYVDPGLGDAFYEPVPLAVGEYEQPPFQLSLERSAVEADGWHLIHDPRGGFEGMHWTAPEVDMTAFAARHQWLTTSPDSPFLTVSIAECRDATGVDVMRGLVRLRVGDGASSETVTDRRDWFGALADLFDLRFDHLPRERVDRLWEAVVATHRRWEAAGQP